MMTDQLRIGKLQKRMSKVLGSYDIYYCVSVLLLIPPVVCFYVWTRADITGTLVRIHSRWITSESLPQKPPPKQNLAVAVLG